MNSLRLLWAHRAWRVLSEARPWPLFVALLGFGSVGTNGWAAQRYMAGDIVEPFTLVERTTGRALSREDFAGKIVFLEWFAWWCPFCQASAPQVAEGIDRWYAQRGGNPAGIPVMHVAVNLQGGQETQTANFVNRAGFGLVLEDFDRALANRFQSGGQPIFAILNGVSNEPNHAQWELLLHQNGYGQRDFSESIREFRAVIDRVEKAAPPPSPARLGLLKIGEHGDWEVEVTGDPGRRWILEASSDLLAWTEVAAGNDESGSATVRLPGEGGSRFFRVRSE